jgi:hypothetical protein
MASIKVVDLRKRMVELGLSSKGNRGTLLERLAESYLKDSLPCIRCHALEERVKVLEERLANSLPPVIRVENRKTPEKVKKPKKKRAQRTTTDEGKKKVLLLSDSHGRHCAGFLQEELGGEYEVSGMVKPGAPLKEVLRDCSRLGRGVDVLLVQAGSNDLSPRGRANIAPVREELARLPSSTRVVLLGVPPRHDRPYLNPSANQLNEALQSIAKEQKGIFYENPFTSFRRQHFTRHGLHMNGSGKRLFAKSLAKVCCI